MDGHRDVPLFSSCDPQVVENRRKACGSSASNPDGTARRMPLERTELACERIRLFW
jgi:hypothetical protein